MPAILDDTEVYLTLAEVRALTGASQDTLKRSAKAKILRIEKDRRVSLRWFNLFVARKFPKINPMTPEELYSWRASH